MKNFETTTLPTGSKQQGLPRALGGSALLLAGALLSGCATVANPDPRDPLESYNRSMTNFNEQVDAMVLKPVAIAYQDIAPALVRTGVSNFFANIGDVWSFVNNVLQLRAEAAASTFMRVNVNTFMGLGGVLDIGVHQAKKVIDNRYGINNPDRTYLNQSFYKKQDLQRYMNEIGLTKEKMVVSIPDKSPNITLYFLNRKGWTNINIGESNIGPNIVNLKYSGAEYLVISNQSVMTDNSLKPLLNNKIGEFNGSISFYTL